MPDFRDDISLAHGRVTVEADAVTVIYSGPRGFLDRRDQSPLTKGTSGFVLILQDIPVLPSGVGDREVEVPFFLVLHFSSLSLPLCLFFITRVE